MDNFFGDGSFLRQSKAFLVMVERSRKVHDLTTMDNYQIKRLYEKRYWKGKYINVENVYLVLTSQVQAR